jgi:osmotically-inducible protein OsmY
MMKNDSQLKSDIIDELGWDPSVDATEVGVIVKDGIVTLTGHVGSYAEKIAVEHATQRVKGVMGVAQEIKVRLSSINKREDADIATAARNSLNWNALVPDTAVLIKVENGRIELSGELEWDYLRKAAEKAVRHLRGVTAVENHIKVKAKISTEIIQKNVIHALARQAVEDARNLHISVQGSCLMLEGKVHSLPESLAAQNVAWSTPGVTDVVNKIKIIPDART